MSQTCFFITFTFLVKTVDNYRIVSNELRIYQIYHELKYLRAVCVPSLVAPNRGTNSFLMMVLTRRRRVLVEYSIQIIFCVTGVTQSFAKSRLQSGFQIACIRWNCSLILLSMKIIEKFRKHSKFLVNCYLKKIFLIDLNRNDDVFKNLSIMMMMVMNSTCARIFCGRFLTSFFIWRFGFYFYRFIVFHRRRR